jgi:hypothetical protein
MCCEVRPLCRKWHTLLLTNYPDGNCVFPSFPGTILDGNLEVPVKHGIILLNYSLHLKKVSSSVSKISKCLYHLRFSKINEQSLTVMIRTRFSSISVAFGWSGQGMTSVKPQQLPSHRFPEWRGLCLRYIDDVLAINNHNFYNCVHFIYPNELEIKDTTDSDMSTSCLDILRNIDSNGRLTTT